MNLITATKQYINQMITMAGGGMKILIVDTETLQVITRVFSMSDIMQREVFLCERITAVATARPEPIKHLKCVCYVRPTKANIALLCQELRAPRYGSYFLFFSHALAKQDLKLLAEADEHENVMEVHEFYADFLPCAPFLYATLNSDMDSITAMLLSIRRCPLIRYQNCSDRCASLAKKISNLVTREALLFDFGVMNEQRPVLLIVDRKFDPVTPLLTQWTYEAMLHELIGISTGNRLDLSHLDGVRADLREIVLSTDHDEFYRANQYRNFGDLCLNVKRLMEDFQQTRSKTQSQIESISDMKHFIENYPTFKKMSGDVAKHVTLISELQKQIGAHRLLELSECEQEMVVRGDHADSLERVRRLIASPDVRDWDAMRLVMLYALRFENNSRQELDSLIRQLTLRNNSASSNNNALNNAAAPSHHSLFSAQTQNNADTPNNDAITDYQRAINEILQFGGAKQRGGGGGGSGQLGGATGGGGIDQLFSNWWANIGGGESASSSGVSSSSSSSSTFALPKKLFQRATAGNLKGVDNIYTQHRPLLSNMLELLSKGKLREAQFPFLGSPGPGATATIKPRDIFVFVVGGVTHEEALAVHQFNSVTQSSSSANSNNNYNHNSGMDRNHSVHQPLQQQQQVNVVLGGSKIHNSHSFLREVRLNLSNHA